MAPGQSYVIPVVVRDIGNNKISMVASLTEHSTVFHAAKSEDGSYNSGFFHGVCVGIISLSLLLSYYVKSKMIKVEYL